METWPSTLPQYPDQQGFSETIRDPVLRTAMDAGPEKARLRYTAVPEQYKMTMHMTKEQRATFVNFYKSSLGYGVDEFYWYHPINVDGSGDRITVVCRFTSMYTITADNNEFSVTFSMEVLP